jgi:hypothetical protein
MKSINIVLKVTSIVAGLAAYTDVIPAKLMPVAMLVFALSSTIKDIAIKAGDYLDNKQMDGSFKG